MVVNINLIKKVKNAEPTKQIKVCIELSQQFLIIFIKKGSQLEGPKNNNPPTSKNK